MAMPEGVKHGPNSLQNHRFDAIRAEDASHAAAACGAFRPQA
jgi:hypothetical protein